MATRSLTLNVFIAEWNEPANAPLIGPLMRFVLRG